MISSESFTQEVTQFVAIVKQLYEIRMDTTMFCQHRWTSSHCCYCVAIIHIVSSPVNQTAVTFFKVLTSMM